MSNHIGLLSAAPAALGPALSNPPPLPSLPHAVFRHVPTRPFPQPQLASSPCLWILIIDNTHGAAVNRRHFASSAGETLCHGDDEDIPGGGWLHRLPLRARTVLCLSLDAGPFPK